MSGVGLTLGPHPTMLPLHTLQTFYRTRRVATGSRFTFVVDLMKKWGIQSGCALPLTTAHHRRGVLLFGSDEAEGYSQEDICFLSLAI
jgi:hypothetical protein